MRRQYRWVCMLLFFVCAVFCTTDYVLKRVDFVSFAIEINESMKKIYKVFSTDGKYLIEKEDVNVGDEFLTKNFDKYKIISKDKENGLAVAEWVEKVEKPKIDFGFSSKPIVSEKPVVALYMTHNDESYVPTDEVSSVYGAGGIHDVTKKLASCFENEGITAVVDETLHIPHDSYAYSRSKKTAQALIEECQPDCIFDIHRDGASRKTYVKTVGGKERCMVRVVVGKASANYESAEQLALYLLAVAEEVCDWLFLDIYYATGHYNQGLHNKALLFEMGSHLVEKELVLETTNQLAKVINVAFFNTTVDKETGDMTINGEVTDQTPTINQLFAEGNTSSNGFGYHVSKVLMVLLAGGFTIAVVYGIGRKPKKRKKK